MFESLGTCLYPAGGKSWQEGAVGADCDTRRHTAAQWAPAAGGLERYQGPQRKERKFSVISFSIAAKSWKRCWNSSAREEMFAHTSSFACWYCSLENWSLFPAAMGNVWYWAAFGKVAAWSQRLWCVNTVGLPLHFAPEGSCSARSDVVLCQLKIQNQPAKQDQIVLASVVPFLPRILRFLF